MIEDFEDAFQSLTGRRPFPWQRELFRRMAEGDFPEACILPTGLGKTSVIAIWLIALVRQPDCIPRRLVYVVNRRTVVDQTTEEVTKLRHNLQIAGLQTQLAGLCSMNLPDGASPLAISTLRGQFADNREWSADPARPAVIIGTVDMIGSRILFSGYGVGFKAKPLHAGFLGQDVLLVHDEAHLEPAFQQCLIAIQREQKQRKEFRSLRVMALSATSRENTNTFELTEEEKNPPSTLPKNATEPIHFVWQRQSAAKRVRLHENLDERKLAEQIVEIALQYRDSKQQILIFVRKVDDVGRIVTQLESANQKVLPLTGTLRGLERDRLVEKAIFQRFLPNALTGEETVYLVCTSAGEVGVNISARHLVCDLTTFDSMAQRFGRVNRFGAWSDSEIHVVHPKEVPIANEIDHRRHKTLKLLVELKCNGSPKAINDLNSDERRAAFAPEPELLPTSEILFDAWALTTIIDKLPGRPPVEPYLHGVEDEEASETQFAWRDEVALTARKASPRDVEELLDEIPLRPHELLRVTTFGKGRAYDQLQKIAIRDATFPLWIIEPDGSVITTMTVSEVVTKRGTGYAVPLSGRTIVLPPQAGGLTANGTLDGGNLFSSDRDYDVYDRSPGDSLLRFKVTVDSEGRTWLSPVTNLPEFKDNFPSELTVPGKRYREINALFRRLKLPVPRLVFSLELVSNLDDENDRPGVREILIFQKISSKKNLEGTPGWPTLDEHLDGVRQCVRKICDRLKLPEELVRPLELSGAYHDLGKARAIWQRGAGNEITNSLVCKTIHGRPPENLNRYRHEFGSLVDLYGVQEFAKELGSINENQRELVLHLIAAHHGRGRPHFPTVETNDSEAPSTLVESVLTDVPSRFARLQRRFGRWGLAYLESILRAADILDSKRIESSPISDPEAGDWPSPVAKSLIAPRKPPVKPKIQVDVDRSNPGHVFACCGLLELADRLWPGVEGWFDGTKFCIAGSGELIQILDTFAECELTNTMTALQHARFDELSSKSLKERKNVAGLEDEYKALGKLVREAPLVLRSPFNIQLDWFVDDYAGGSRFKTWAGQQSVLGIAKSMKDALNDTCWRNEHCLMHSATGCGLPFNFDADLGSQGGAIDVGFSFDPLAASALTRIDSAARPALELLAFVGLQRFRPKQINNDNRFLYVTWNRPLPLSIASAAACAALPISGSERFEFRLLYRTKYLKSFLPAVPFYGDSDE